MLAIVLVTTAYGAPPQWDPETRSRLTEAKSQVEAAPLPPLLTRQALMAPATLIDAALSVDGRDLASIKREGDRFSLVVRRLEDRQDTRVLSGALRIDVRWASDGAGLWAADEHGVIWFDASSRHARRVYRWPESHRQSFQGVDRHAPGYALIQSLPEAGTQGLVNYLRVDREGEVTRAFSHTHPVVQLRLRADGSPAFSVHQEAPDYDTVVRHHEHGATNEVLRCQGLERCRIAHHSANGSTAWMLSQRGSDLLGVQLWQQTPARNLRVDIDPEAVADLADLVVDDTGVKAVAFDRGRRQWAAVDPAWARPLARLQALIPEASLELAPTRDGATWLVKAEHESWSQRRYYLFRPNSGQLTELFADLRGIQPEPGHLGIMVPLRYLGSDGVRLHGYVLLPRGRRLTEAPLIAWLHGGPATREHATFDPRLQLLANRGYAVFIPNFRGSDGFGIAYKRSANGDVGNGRVLRDVLEGMDLLLAAGIGNRQRQAVMGHSFGGYLTLVAATHRPERFSFAWAAAPPTDYGWMKQWQAEHDSPLLRGDARPLRLSFPLHGYDFRDPAWRKRMANESPRQGVAEVRRPIYLWAGGRDTHVPLASLGQYAGELSRLQKPVSLLVDPDAGHSPDDAKAAESYLYLLEASAHRHFQGGLQPPDVALRERLVRDLKLGASELLGR